MKRIEISCISHTGISDTYVTLTFPLGKAQNHSITIHGPPPPCIHKVEDMVQGLCDELHELTSRGIVWNEQLFLPGGKSPISIQE